MLVWLCQKDAKRQTAEINNGMGPIRKKKKGVTEGPKKKLGQGGWKQPQKAEIQKKTNGWINRHGVWVPEGGSSCWDTGYRQIDIKYVNITLH